MKSVRKLSRKVMGEKRLKSDGEIGNDEVFSDSSAELECRSAPPIPDFPQFPFKMPSAIPGVGDCHICCEVVPSVKILNCGHCLCVACASRMTGGGRKPLSCPECRELTDLTAGVQSLPTKYFGKIKCDICLSQKDTDDMWWCNQCAMALCSKCSIKDHSKKNHTSAISEWNKLDPVLYSLKYINGMRLNRQQTYLDSNQSLIRRFMAEVEEILHQKLACPKELEDLRTSLVSHYGTNITSFDYSENETGAQRQESLESNTSNDSGPKVIAKVLQVAGVNIVENLIPTISDRSYQVQFGSSPTEVADYLVAKIRFVPVGDDDSDLTQLPLNRNSQDYPRAGRSRDGPIEMTAETIFPRPKMHIPVVEAVVTDNDMVALRSDREVFLCQPNANKDSVVVAPADKNFAGISANPRLRELLVVLHSNTRRHEWTLESWNVAQLPHSINFTAQLDIDPDDRVLSLSVTNSRNSAVMYEIRNCERSVSEVWRIQVVEKRSKAPKVKEVLLHQKSGAQYCAPLCAFDEPKGASTTFVVWDKLCRFLLKMSIRNGRCEQILKILTAAEDSIPFCLDANGFLWVFDNDQGELRATKAPVATKAPSVFTTVARYENSRLNYLTSQQNGKVQGVSLSGPSVTLVCFNQIV